MDYFVIKSDGRALCLLWGDTCSKNNMCHDITTPGAYHSIPNSQDSSSQKNWVV